MDLIKQIDLAILANGGEDFRDNFCSCDPSVGYTPCEYCAIRNALLAVKCHLISSSSRAVGACAHCGQPLAVQTVVCKAHGSGHVPPPA